MGKLKFSILSHCMPALNTVCKTAAMQIVTIKPKYLETMISEHDKRNEQNFHSYAAIKLVFMGCCGWQLLGGRQGS